ncbi:hypothetical protein AB9P05_19855 [Roseivirga sp. BDSF3-8]|uniref:hypothetical protein n=1 Tax=Roseivirga sp. BDSF3-8 TaxID=3241598 RepID=UPI00353189B6
MRHSYLLYTLLFIFASCIDYDIIPLQHGVIPTCSDGIQNQNEQGVDCGGPCNTECYVPLASPCGDNLNDNTIVVVDDDDIGVDDQNLTTITCQPNEAFEEYRFTGQSINGEIEIILHTLEIPAREGTFDIEWSSSDNIAEVTVTNYGVDWWAQSGTLYVFNTPDGLVLEFCEASFRTNFADYYPVMSAKVICN